jgi:hypothetical protein
LALFGIVLSFYEPAVTLAKRVVGRHKKK